jgi:hypothetical protein
LEPGVRKTVLLTIELVSSLTLFAAAAPARAALGERVQSIEADRAALHGTAVAKRSLNGYTVHEVQVGSTLVREFVAPSGVVFAVAWNGLTHPDLFTLLGTYQAEYEDARRKTKAQGTRRHQTIETDNVVVETWGHMRSLQGRAYVPALVPSGVDVHEIS